MLDINPKRQIFIHIFHMIYTQHVIFFRLIRPVGNSSDRLTVKMGMKLSQIIGIDMKQQIMITNVWVEQVRQNKRFFFNMKDMCMTFIWLFMSSKSQVSVDNFLCQLFVFFYDQTLTLKIDLCFIYDIILANEQKDVVIGTCPYFIHDRRLWPLITISDLDFGQCSFICNTIHFSFLLMKY